MDQESPLVAEYAKHCLNDGQTDHDVAKGVLQRVEQLRVVNVHAFLDFVQFVMRTYFVVFEPFTLVRTQLVDSSQSKRRKHDPASRHEPPLHLQVLPYVLVFL